MMGRSWLQPGSGGCVVRPHPRHGIGFGALLEKRGDFRGALEAYRKSLETEWNQPPIMEARRRLEQIVK